MKHISSFILMLCMLLLTACGLTTAASEESVPITATSRTQADECYLCSEGMIPSSGQAYSLGLLDLNSFSIQDLDFVNFNTDGTVDFSTVGYMRTSSASFGGNYIYLYAFPDQRYIDITITYNEKSAVDYDALSEKMCQDCLDTVLALENSYLDSNLDMPSLVLLDFSTNKLYSICEWQRGYGINEYVVKIFHSRADKIKTELLIFYTGGHIDGNNENTFATSIE